VCASNPTARQTSRKLNKAANSWQINYLWEQSISSLGDDPARGWGTFLLLAVSDGDPNPFAFSAAAGLVANGVCEARPCDSFGLGLFYNAVSDELQDTLEGSPGNLTGIDLQDEFGGEIFYDFAVTDWLRISADLQIVQPVIEDNNTAIFGGLRSRIVF
jgi:porin